jgi:hypothetical protein
MFDILNAARLTPDDAVMRFTKCAEILRAATMSNETVISYPVVGSTTLAVVVEVLAGRVDPAAAVPIR